MSRKIFTFLVGILFFTPLFSQRIVHIEHSDSLIVNQITHPGIQRLLGNVVLIHDTAIMYCDSAYLNKKMNSFVAYGNIHIEKPMEEDTIFLYSDSLTYDGQISLARARNNVRMVRDSMILLTDNMDYNMEDDIGFYFDGGVTQNGEDTLISKMGYYYAETEELFFKDDVEIYNPDFVMYSDTLRHALDTKVSYFLGPTEIIGRSDSNYIYCENGWYDHEQDKSQFGENAFLRNDDKTLKGDSLFYDRTLGYGEGFQNVEIVDSTENVIMLGHYGYYNENTELSILTDSAVFINITEENDSLFIHADTLFSIVDTLYSDIDTIDYRIVKAYRKVKTFKSDFQTKCDSLVYSFLDSTIQLFYEPILWSDENQITADFIKIHTENEEVRQIDMHKSAFIVSQSDSFNFNQISGKDMVAHVKDNKLHKIDVTEEGETVYYAVEDDETVGVTKIACKNMIIYMENQEVKNIWFYVDPIGAMYPPNWLTPDEFILSNFHWLDNLRPKSRNDIFVW